MKAILASLLVLGACIGDDIDHAQVIPGGNSLVPAGGTSVVFIARVCRSTDLLRRDLCVLTGLAGLTVELGNQTAITEDDGTFVINVPTTTTPDVILVRGVGAVTTTTPFDRSLTTIPVVDADVFARALASNQIGIPAGSGTVLGTVIRNGQPVTGITVISTPTSAFNPIFDAGTIFAPGQTGSRGIFLVPGVTAGNAALTFTPGETLVAGIPIVNGGVTILDSTVLP